MDITKSGAGSLGGVEVSDAVISAIVLKAAGEIDGVSGFAPCPKGFAALREKGKAAESVRIDADETEVRLHVYLKVKRSRPIPDIALEVQQSVRTALESMTGRRVAKVDVTVAEIEFPED